MVIVQGARLTDDSDGTCGDVSLNTEILSCRRHHRYKVIRINKIVAEAGTGFGIEYLFQPVDHDLMPIGISKLLVTGQPKIGVMMDAWIDGNQGCSQCNR